MENSSGKKTNLWAFAGLLFIFVFPPTYWVLTTAALTAMERAGYLALFLGAEALGFALFFFDMLIVEKLLLGVAVLSAVLSGLIFKSKKISGPEASQKDKP